MGKILTANEQPTSIGLNWKDKIPDVKVPGKESPTDSEKVYYAALQAALGAQNKSGVEVIIAPPEMFLGAAMRGVAKAKQMMRGATDFTNAYVYAQNCSYPYEDGTHTGETPALMFKRAGVHGVIVGHSERREFEGETNEIVKAKAQNALDVGLKTIVCFGEKFEDRYIDKETQRDPKAYLEVIGKMLEESIPDNVPDNTKLVLAYEPVWAIGTGVQATNEQIAETMEYINNHPSVKGKGYRIQYGGSVKPDTVNDVTKTEGCHGALVGGASLQETAPSLVKNAQEAEVSKGGLGGGGGGS